MSEAEYLALPEVKPYLEYVDGMVLQKPMASYAHGTIAAELIFELRTWTGADGGSLGTEIGTREESAGNYLVPDVSYWAPGRARGNDTVPTLAVEVLSPGQTMNELRAKCRSYRNEGVDVCWIIDPDRRVAEVLEDGRDAEPVPPDGALESPLLPGFSLALQRLFAVLDR
ncbi:MAG: Uma2 family endonuclease [Dehalococcoidia bacterium]